MTSISPETLARFREALSGSEALHEHPDLVDRIVRVVDEFYDMHVSSSPHSPFIEAWEKKARHGRDIEFFIPETVLFLAKVAGEGVLQNVAWAVVKEITNRFLLSEHRRGIKFEAVVSIETYRKERSLQHPGTKPSRKAPGGFEETIRKQYKLSIGLKAGKAK